MKKLVLLLMLVFSVVAFGACNSKPKVEGLIEEGKLYVGLSADYAPYEFIDLTKEGDEKYVGSDITFMKKIAEELGLQLVLKPMAFDNILTALDTDKIDIAISGFTYAPDRVENYLFSSAYFDDGEGDQILVFNKANQEKFKSLEDLNKADVKVGAQNGSLQQSLVTEQLPNANHIFFEDVNNAFTALKDGQYDAIAVASVVAEALLSSEENKDIVASSFMFEVEDSALYAIMKKGNEKLAEAINPVCEEVAKGDYQKWLDAANQLYEDLGENAGSEIIEPEE